MDQVVLIILLVVFLLFFLNSDKPIVTKFKKRVKSIKEKFLPLYGFLTGANDRLYRLLDAVKGLFLNKGIPFAITGDVLLSAVEKKRLTRGQSQATILIPQQNVNDLLSLTGNFAQLGLGLNDIRDGGFILTSAVSLPTMVDTSITILPVQLAGDRWITISKYHGYNEWYGANELFPGKMYELGRLDMPGPANPINYLHRNYWSLGIRATDFRKWYQMSPSFYGTNQLPVMTPISDIDYINGINIDPRPIPGTQTVVLGNGRTAVIPNVGGGRTFPRSGRWRRYLWI